MPFTPETKNPGDLIKSQDWNEAMNEIVRLESDKVNKTGDVVMTGPLTIEGNVGIGAATPNEPLSFDNTTGPKINLFDDGAGIYGFGISPAELQIGTYDADKHISLGHYSGSSKSFVELMRVEGNGNVGIGRTDPQAKLDVNGALIVRNSGDGAVLLNLSSDRSWQFQQSGTGAGTALKLKSIGGGGNKDFIIETDGQVGIGTTSPQTKLHIVGGTDVELQGGGFLVLGSITGGNIAMDNNEIMARNNGVAGNLFFQASGGGVTIGGKNATSHKLLVMGSAAKPGGGFWTNSSDKRLKKNIKPLIGSIGKLLELRGVSYEWKEPEKHGNLSGKQMGLVAQEVEEVFPEWVGTEPDGMKNLTIMGFEALVIEAIRELEARVKDLENRSDSTRKSVRARKK